MTDAVLQELAKLIAQQQLYAAWPYVIALIALSSAAGAIAGFGASYFRKRGETAATKADFDELVRQSREIAASTETAKTLIFQEAWASREALSVRRIKLEDLVLAVYEERNWFVKQRSFLAHGQGTDPGPSSIDKVLVLANLYFPELALESKKLFNVHLRFYASQLKIVSAKNNNSESEEQQKIVATETANSARIYSELLTAIEDIEKASHSLMAGILSLPKQQLTSASLPHAAQVEG